MIKIYKKYREKINIEKNLQALSFGALFAFTQNIFIILVVICVILFPELFVFSSKFPHVLILVSVLLLNSSNSSFSISTLFGKLYLFKTFNISSFT